MKFYTCLLFVLLFYIFSIFQISDALECYVCTRQEKNADKCLKTIKTCEHDQNVCLSEISWGTTPYWSQGAEKQYYISKRCARRDECERIRTKLMPFCTHIWYQDWRCSECCRGDKCNYFVILSGSTARSSVVIIFISVVATLAVRMLF